MTPKTTETEIIVDAPTHTTFVQPAAENTRQIAAVEETKPGSVITLFESIVKNNPTLGVENLERMMALQERLLDRQAVIDFNNAMADLQPKLPQIVRGAKAHNGKYARYEDVDEVVRPLYTDAGFTISYDTKGNTHFGTISHRSGHSKTCQIDFAPDKSGNKNDPQAVISALSYAKRNLLQMLLNIVTKGEDDDAAGAPVTDEQAKNIKDGLKECGVDFDSKKFLKILKANNVEEIPANKYRQAMMMINAKRWEDKQKGEKDAKK